MRSFITLLSTDNYYEGVLALQRQLKSLKSRYPLHCVLSTGVNSDIQKLLESSGISCIRLNKQAVKVDENTPAFQNNQCLSYWSFTFDKLCIWGLTQFEKLVFIDSDMLILSNLDSLFECEPFSAVCAGASVYGHETWYELNSGLMVIRPDKSIEKDLINLCRSVIIEYKKSCRPVGDQDIINNYIPNWKDKQELHLDEAYNIFADNLTYYIRNLEYSLTSESQKKEIKVVHFIGKFKPWMKPSFRNRIWLFRTWICNPYYYIAYKKFRSYLSDK